MKQKKVANHTASTVPGVVLHRFPVIRDARGNLVAGEFKKQIGFIPRRYFLVFGVPSLKNRGEHAHKVCHQFLVCLQGALKVTVDDGDRRQTFSLNKINRGVYVPPMIWCSHFNYRPGTILLVFASHSYDPDDYIRDRTSYLRRRARRRQPSLSGVKKR